jgi:TonB family protein
LQSNTEIEVLDPQPAVSTRRFTMKPFAVFLLLVCSGLVFGQKVNIHKIQVELAKTHGVAEITIWAELLNTGHDPITVRDASFSLESLGGDTYESYAGPYAANRDFAWGERINPGVTAEHELFFKVPSTINLHEPMKLRLGGGWMTLYGDVTDWRPNPTNAVERYTTGEPLPSPAPEVANAPGTVNAQYVDVIKRTVARNWYLQEVQPSTAAGATVYVQFTVARDGTPSSVTLATPSSSPSLNSSCLHAVQRVDTFGSLPQDYPNPTLNVLYHCTYPGPK